jgi:hypothetical protein
MALEPPGESLDWTFDFRFRCGHRLLASLGFRAPVRGGGLAKGSVRLVFTTLRAFFSRTKGLGRAMISLVGRTMVPGELQTG